MALTNRAKTVRLAVTVAVQVPVPNSTSAKAVTLKLSSGSGRPEETLNGGGTQMNNRVLDVLLHRGQKAARGHAP